MTKLQRGMLRLLIALFFGAIFWHVATLFRWNFDDESLAQSLRARCITLLFLCAAGSILALSRRTIPNILLLLNFALSLILILFLMAWPLLTNFFPDNSWWDTHITVIIGALMDISIAAGLCPGLLMLPATRWRRALQRLSVALIFLLCIAAAAQAGFQSEEGPLSHSIDCWSHLSPLLFFTILLVISMEQWSPKPHVSPGEPAAFTVSMICPRCHTPHQLPAGHSACPTCRYTIELTIHDPACPRCSYNLRGLQSPACPECGLLLASTDSHNPSPAKQ